MGLTRVRNSGDLVRQNQPAEKTGDAPKPLPEPVCKITLCDWKSLHSAETKEQTNRFWIHKNDEFQGLVTRNLPKDTADVPNTWSIMCTVTLNTCFF